MSTDEYPPYTPMPSLGHELGLMFGFLSLCIVVIGAYIAIWRVSQTRVHAQDLAHRKAFRTKSPTQQPLGTTTSITASPAPSISKDSTEANAPLHEKMLDRFGMPINRAELPAHGMEMYASGKGKSRMPHIKCPFGNCTAITPVDPASPLGSRGLAAMAATSGPVRGGFTLDSMVGVAFDGGRGLNQTALPHGFRSASPARRFGGGISPLVETGPAPSRE